MSTQCMQGVLLFLVWFNNFVSNFTELHTLPLAARSYALLIRHNVFTYCISLVPRLSPRANEKIVL